MQSFLQYRRLNRGVRRGLQQSGKLPRSSDVPSQEVDTEKGEASNATGTGAKDSALQAPVQAQSHALRTTTHQDGSDEASQGVNNRSSDPILVEFDGPTDPVNPHNWSVFSRIVYTFVVGNIGFVVSFASSIDSTIWSQAAAEFNVSEVAETLSVATFLLGFGVGCLFTGPFSETFGRQPIYIIALATYMVFIMASGLAPNYAAQIIFRLLAGLFAAPPLTVSGGSIADMWNSVERIWAFPIYAITALSGAAMGPVVGGWIAENDSLTWRWVEWITLIWSAVVLFAVSFIQPETFAPMILSWKAHHLRSITGDPRYRAAIETRTTSFWQRMVISVSRPFIMAQEPIIILWTLYLTVAYIVLFTFLGGYDFIFAQTYDTSPGITGTIFIGIVIGMLFSYVPIPIMMRMANRELRANKGEGAASLAPEFRLWYTMLGGSFAMPISLFWMGWTAQSQISIWSPIIASAMFGFSFLTVLLSCYAYIIEVFEIYAASALTLCTIVRYFASGGMTVATLPFYQNLGVQYTLTILACIAAALVPVPYLFYIYGEKVRSWSKFATSRHGHNT